MISALKRRALWPGTIFQPESIRNSKLPITSPAGFIRGFRRAYKQGAHYLLTILISIACGDQSSLWGKIAKIGVKIGEHFHFRLILNIYFGQMLSPHPLV